jgi:hypothetical protein
MDCEHVINICYKAILDNISYSDALEIHGVVEKDGICEQTQNGEPFDFFSLYLHLKEGSVICIGDFGINCLDKLHVTANTLSSLYELPVLYSNDKAALR